MVGASIFTAKVVGTTSIGLWAGYNLSLVHHPAQTSSECGGFAQLFSMNGSKRIDLQQVKTRLLAWLKPSSRKGADDAATKADPPAKPVRTLTAADVLRLSFKALHASTLSGLAFAANFFAYARASTSGKHPYLLYLALGAPLVGMLQYYGARKLSAQTETKSVRADDEDEDVEIVGDISAHEKETNPFTLEDKYSIFSSVVAGLSSFLYVISVIGLAGDASF